MADGLRAALLIVTALLVASCDNKGSDNSASHDVNYYVSNPEDRKTKLAECNNNPGDLEDTPDCINASEAEIQAMNAEIERAIKQD